MGDVVRCMEWGPFLEIGKHYVVVDRTLRYVSVKVLIGHSLWAISGIPEDVFSPAVIKPRVRVMTSNGKFAERVQ